MHSNLPQRVLAEAAIELDRAPTSALDIAYTAGILHMLGEYHDAIYLQRHAESVDWLCRKIEVARKSVTTDAAGEFASLFEGPVTAAAPDTAETFAHKAELADRLARVAEIVKAAHDKAENAAGAAAVAIAEEGQLP